MLRTRTTFTASLGGDAMEAGTCFLIVDKQMDDHLWVVLSDPKVDDQKVLVVNLNTPTEKKEKVCLLQPGDHPWIRKTTCVNYADSWVQPLAQFLEWKHKGIIKLIDPMPVAVLERMRQAVLDSTRIPMDNANLLIAQGLVDDEG